MAMTPKDAKISTDSRNMPLNNDDAKWWSQHAVAAMRLVLRAKFHGNVAARAALLDTGGAILVAKNVARQASHKPPRGDFWEAGEHGDGANMHGRLLMEIRQQIRAANARPRDVSEA